MNCKLVGNFVQHLEVELQPREEFYAEKGALIYMEDGIERSTALSGGGGLTRILGAKLSGESIFIVKFTNLYTIPRKLVLGSEYGLLPIKLQNESIICHQGVYVASNNQVGVTTKLSIAGATSGMGFMLQKISGNSTVFLDAIGQPIVKELAYGDSIYVDENHIIALQGITESQMSSSWSLKNIFGGEGLSLLKINGPGRVYLSPGNLNPPVPK